jgi:hypothetical protein
MPKPAHTRISALGRVGTAGERFSYGVNMIATNPGQSQMPSQSEAEDIAADFKAFHGRATSRISAQCVLEEVKVASIGEDGKYTEDPIIVAALQAGQGGNIGYTLPQAALVASLVTERRGPSGKGRFFIPMPEAQLESGSLLLPVLIVEQVRASVAQLITALNNEPGLDGLERRVAVISTKGFTTLVTGVRVGRVVDTMRSRRKGLAESYTSTLAAG